MNIPESKKDINKTAGIFCIQIGDYRYIGFSKQIEVVSFDYRSWLKHKRHQNKEMQTAFDNNNEKFEVTILEELSGADKRKMEEKKQFWMEHSLASYLPSTNLGDMIRQEILPLAEPDRNTQIKTVLNQGKTVKEVAAEFGLSESSIRKIKAS